MNAKTEKPCELTQSLCAWFVQNVDLWQKNHGKIDGKNSFWKRPGEGPRKAAAEEKTIKRMGPGRRCGVIRAFFGLPELYRKAYNTDKPVLVCVDRRHWLGIAFTSREKA